MVAERLRHVYQTRNNLPAHILFYRDGVSESQYGMVKDEELSQIQKAFESIVKENVAKDSKLKDAKVSITLLVVGKRHHTRFLPTDENDEKNHPAGLCVDSDVIVPHEFSFYLQSHESTWNSAIWSLRRYSQQQQLHAQPIAGHCKSNSRATNQDSS